MPYNTSETGTTTFVLYTGETVQASADDIVTLHNDELALRTDEELVRLACDELGFARLGSRIKGRLEAALTRWRRTHGG